MEKTDNIVNPDTAFDHITLQEWRSLAARAYRGGHVHLGTSEHEIHASIVPPSVGRAIINALDKNAITNLTISGTEQAPYSIVPGKIGAAIQRATEGSHGVAIFEYQEPGKGFAIVSETGANILTALIPALESLGPDVTGSVLAAISKVLAEGAKQSNGPMLPEEKTSAVQAPAPGLGGGKTV